MPGTARTLDLADLPAWAEAQAKGVQAAGTDLRPAWRDVGLLFVSDTRENFADSHGPGGSPWAALKFARPAGGDRPLYSTGMLMASFVAGGAGHVEEATGSTFVWGSNHQTAGVHQDGATILPRNGRLLAIPLTPKAAHYSPRGSKDLPAFPDPLFLLRGKSGKPVLATGGKRGGRLTPQYVLVPSVTIPARPMIGFHERLLVRLDDVLLDRLTAALTA